MREDDKSDTSNSNNEGIIQTYENIQSIYFAGSITDHIAKYIEFV